MKKKIILQTKQGLMDEELHEIIVQFGLAMKSAYPHYIAKTGKMTDRMECVWELYREWCMKSENNLKENNK